MFETNLDTLVRKDHPYRKILKIVNFRKLSKKFEKECYSNLGRGGYHPEQGVKMLFLQFYLNLSDRELEECLEDSNAAKFFCGFSLTEKTPSYSYFSKFRSRLGTRRVAEVFGEIRKGLRGCKLIGEVFTFVDSSKIEACVDTWAARDKALADAENRERDDDDKPTMNNQNVGNYSRDKDARYGAKGKKDFWIGYKRHVAVDMRHGFITKVAVTPANIHDGVGLKHVLPRQGAVVGDKAYSGAKAEKEIERRGLHSMAIKPRNRKDKDPDKDRFIASIRMPYEGVFARKSKRAWYVGTVKVQFQAFMEAIVFNVKRALVLDADPIPISKGSVKKSVYGSVIFS